MTRILCTLFLFLCSNIFAQNISTIAGGGPRNLTALQTGIPSPRGVATYGGSVYVSLPTIGQIWKIDGNSLVTVYAGNGARTFAGDGGPAVDATLNPYGLAFDSTGNLYVADGGHGRVRKISTGGIISTVAGGGIYGNPGDGGLATAASLKFPISVSLDSSNNLYIADLYDYRIRLVSPTGIISTVAGNGLSAFLGDGGAAISAGLYSPSGVLAAGGGAFYIIEGSMTAFAMPRLRKVTAGIIDTIAGNGILGHTGDGGPAKSANISAQNIAFDNFGNVILVEPWSLRNLSAGSTGIFTINTFAGTNYAYGPLGDGGPPLQASFNDLTAVAYNAQNRSYLADAGSNRIRLDLISSIATFAGNGSLDFNSEGLPALNASILGPNGLSVDSSGSLIYTDGGSSSLRKVTLSTGLLSTVGGTGIQGLSSDGALGIRALYDPVAPVADPRGGYYFVEQDSIRKVTNGALSTIANSANAHGFSGDGGQALAASFNGPSGLALAANGDLFVADLYNSRVRVIDARTGIISTVAGNGFPSSTGDGGLATAATLDSPYAVALDGAGNLFVAERFGNRVRKINLASNVIFTVAGDGTQDYADNKPAVATGLNFPSGIFADQSGNLFIADTRHSSVRKVAAGTGIITTVAGTGVDGFSGDGGPATAALTTPNAIAIDRNQNLYIADASGRIRTTQVSACFFTLGTPVFLASSTGGTATVTITATNSTCPYSLMSDSPFVTISGAASGTGSGTVTFSIAANSGVNRSATVNVGGASFTVTQSGAQSQANVGFFQPANPVWALDANGNGVFDAGDKYFPFTSQPGAIAVSGDWNGDGRSKIGIYFNGFWALDYNGNGVWDGPNGGDKFYAMGGNSATYLPMVGDWTGDGRTKIGYYNKGFWALDLNGNGTFDAGDGFYSIGGNAGETPLLGDWNGDKRTKVGVYLNGTFTLDYDGDGKFTAADKLYTGFSYVPGDQPVVGDWSGSGTTKIGIYRNGFWVLDYNGNGTYDGIGASGDRFYAFGGQAGNVPMVADWSGDGRSKIGYYNGGFWALDFNGNGQFDGTAPGQDRFLGYGGGAGSQPLIGKW